MPVPVADLEQSRTLDNDDIDHFLQKGWLKVPNAVQPEILESWKADLWTRLRMDENDKSTWSPEYCHLPHHRQVRYEDVCPIAWNKIAELCGGEHMIDPVRERWIGDNFIINFGSEERSYSQHTPANTKQGFHVDNDWYRQFLDSSQTALTIILAFSDIPVDGGGTHLAEDGIAGVTQYLHDHPEGLDPGLTGFDCVQHVKNCKQINQVVAQKGDVIIMHGLLPHSNAYNYLHYPRIISNPHVSLIEPYNLNRPEGRYSLLEQVILRGLGKESVPEYQLTRERKFWYPRNSTFKLVKIPHELEAMAAYAKANGLDESAVDSIHLQGEGGQRFFDRVNGFELPMNEETGLHTEQHPP